MHVELHNMLLLAAGMVLGKRDKIQTARAACGVGYATLEHLGDTLGVGGFA